MTTPIPATPFTDPAPAHRLEQAAAALTAHRFTAYTGVDPMLFTNS